jgi:hypothetical protein
MGSGGKVGKHKPEQRSTGVYDEIAIGIVWGSQRLTHIYCSELPFQLASGAYRLEQSARRVAGNGLVGW